ncbi:MAG TPA: NADH-quinone oxidoreductase subunit C [Vicinamibacterales bacterium]|nr:NADH-quinone oxidoreductase subunit C [Vicinamibacterales bacterium]
MSDVHAVLGTLRGAGLCGANVSVRHERELHCSVEPAHVVRFAELACTTLAGEILLLAAEDRRRQENAFHVHYLFGKPGANWFIDAVVRLDGRAPQAPSLAPFHYPASRFEREITDLFGITFVGHPDPRPLVRHGFWPDDYHPLRKDAAPRSFRDDGRPFPFTPVGGEGVYEIPVGPVHAGVIEPGHFRFSVMGETIIDMKSRLYFTHKGTEKLFEGRRPQDGVELAERVSGDTSVGHALAYCQAVEAASRIDVPARARYLRVLLLELERLYNHVADFGAIANDTGFAIAYAHCYRIRERLLRLNKRWTGSRLLRGALVPGGVTRDLPPDLDLAAEIAAAVADFEEVVEICLGNTLLLDRLEGTGVLSRESAADHGVLGYIARASGVDIDARRDYPFAAYGEMRLSVPVMTSGDVKARALVRVEEVRESLSLVRQACRALPGGPIGARPGRIEPLAPAFGIVEGWRGRIVHWLTAAEDGTLDRVKIVDPSFLNWPALSRALEGNIVPDFPLCNKSFNQSYSGNDL